MLSLLTHWLLMSVVQSLTYMWIFQFYSCFISFLVSYHCGRKYLFGGSMFAWIFIIYLPLHWCLLKELKEFEGAIAFSSFCRLVSAGKDLLLSVPWADEITSAITVDLGWDMLMWLLQGLQRGLWLAALLPLA